MVNNFIKSQMYHRKSPNLIKLGFDFSKPVEQEYKRIQSILSSEYLIKGESMLTIMKKYNIPSSRTMDILFNLFNIESRSFSNAVGNAVKQKRLNPGYRDFQHIYHKTWYGEEVYLRSTYELEYAKQLDKEKELYYTESIRIKYYDSKLQKYRIAIPDFYLPHKNMLVEIKAKYWYDEENMNDKKAEYKKNGYNFKLILDKEE